MSMSQQTKFQDSSLFGHDVVSSEQFLTFWGIVVPLSSVSFFLDCPRQLLDPKGSFKTSGTTDSMTQYYIPEDLHHHPLKHTWCLWVFVGLIWSHHPLCALFVWCITCGWMGWKPVSSLGTAQCTLWCFKNNEHPAWLMKIQNIYC
jgi:hypothetical protein